MTEYSMVKVFDRKKIRSVWDEEKETWYYSIVDVVAVLTDQPDYQHARNYWKVLKNRLLKEGYEPVTNCNQLKLTAEDGKQRLTDVADPEQLLRDEDIVQAVSTLLHRGEV